MLVDSHCHLTMHEDYHSVIQRAKNAGVKYMQSICTKISEAQELFKIADEHESVFVSIGVHPDSIVSDNDISDVSDLTKLIKSHSKVVGIGETGLDYYKSDSDDKFLLQKKSFINHIQTSQVLDLPLIIHTRNADYDTIDILQSEMRNSSFKGLIHCFGSDINFAKKALDLGLFISFSGIITFKNVDKLIEVVKFMPEDFILIETDSPFLAPVPKRGKKNEPAFVRFVAEKIAEIKNISFESVAQITTGNFLHLFNLV